MMTRFLQKLIAFAAVACAAMAASPAIAGIAYPTNVAGTFADAAVNLQCDASGLNCQPVTALNPVQVNQVDASATGSLGALNAATALNLNGDAGFAVDIRGTFVGTITFQGTVDGTNWLTLAVMPLGSASNVAAVTTATAPGAWTGNSAGMSQVRVIMTAYTSGTATVTLRAMQVTGLVMNFPAGAAQQSTSLTASTTLAADFGVQYRPTATGAASSFSILSPATPAGATIKGSTGRLIGCFLTNTAAALRSVKFFNATSVTMGTTAAVFEIDLPQNAYGYFDLPGGISFATGSMWAVTSAKGLTDNTATGLAANDVSGVCWAA